MEKVYNASAGTSQLLKDVGSFFYLVSREETTFEHIEDVPHYICELLPLFLGLVLAEYIALAMKGEMPRFAESINSLSHGIISETAKILTMGLEISLYVTLHKNYRIIDLSWEDPFTWYAALLGVDFAYYWAHRASHEINFLWQQHQIHHSSEDFNMAVAVRHPITHNWINSFFYLPLALIIPPAQCLAHQQLNLLYQGWIHTSLVGELGPLEWILNTPTHHKVHHGCNLYVLDKNYGGLLIIWDRIFGTFQGMKRDVELVFGVVFQPKSFNPIWQTYYRWPGLWQWAKSQETWADTLRAVFYGPSWLPGVGAPWTGREEDKIDIQPRPKFIMPLPPWLQAYLLLHFVAVLFVFQEFTLKKGMLDEVTIAMTVAYLLVTLTSIGLLSEGNPWASYFEFCRCLVCLLVIPGPEHSMLNMVARYYFAPSMAVWAFVFVQKLSSWSKMEAKGMTDVDDATCSKKSDASQPWTNVLDVHHKIS